MNKVHHQIEIQATPAQIWKCITEKTSTNNGPTFFHRDQLSKATGQPEAKYFFS